MTITLHWWAWPCIFIGAACIYSFFRKSRGDYDFAIDLMLVWVATLCASLGIVAGHFMN